MKNFAHNQMDKQTSWSHLPNAPHIDWVIESVKNNPDLWAAAWEAARGEASDVAWVAVWNAARDAAGAEAWGAAGAEARGEARHAAWKATWGAARNAACDAAGTAARNAACDAALALIAYDDCDQYLAMGYEKLQIWAALSENPAAVLLQPMIYVREKLHNSTKLDSLKKHYKL